MQRARSLLCTYVLCCAVSGFRGEHEGSWLATLLALCKFGPLHHTVRKCRYADAAADADAEGS